MTTYAIRLPTEDGERQLIAWDMLQPNEWRRHWSDENGIRWHLEGRSLTASERGVILRHFGLMKLRELIAPNLLDFLPPRALVAMRRNLERATRLRRKKIMSDNAPPRFPERCG